MRLVAGFLLLLVITGCGLFTVQSDRKRALEACVTKFVNMDVPIEKATESCLKIYENPQTSNEISADGTGTLEQ